MAGMTRDAILKGRLGFETADGEVQPIPLGPCRVEQLDGEMVRISWGAGGACWAALAEKELDQAVANGDLVFVD